MRSSFALRGTVSLAFFFVAIAQAEPHRSTKKGTLASRQVSGAFGRLDVRGDATGVYDFNYVAPNEHLTHLYERELPETPGALVSVGTFRAWNLASSGKISHLVLLDYNRGIVESNRLFGDLFKSSKDRYEFLSLVLTGKRDRELLDAVRTGKLSFDAFLGKLLERAEKTEDYFSKWKAEGITVPPELVAQDRALTQDRFDGNISYGLVAYLRRLQSLGLLSETVFGDDERYMRIVRMLRDDKVAYVQGDLSTKGAVQQLATQLRAKRIPVSALDVSNVPPNFRTYPRPNELFSQLDANVRAFDFAPGGKLLMTDSAYPSERWTREPWDYYAVDPSKFGELGPFYPKTFPAKQDPGFMQALDPARQQITDEIRKRFTPLDRGIDGK